LKIYFRKTVKLLANSIISFDWGDGDVSHNFKN